MDYGHDDLILRRAQDDVCAESLALSMSKHDKLILRYAQNERVCYGAHPEPAEGRGTT